MGFVLISFLIWRILDFLISILASNFIPYLGFFPYKELLVDFHLPQFISSLANFDGIHYILIAKNGYSQYEQAFFPLYPILIRFFSPLFFNNYLLTSIIISNLSFLLGLLIFWKYLKLISTDCSPPQLVATILFFPTSFFFGAVYTEGLFFFLIIVSLYLFKKEKYLFATLFAIFSSFTRLMGAFLIIPFGIQLWQQYRSSKKIPRLKFQHLTLIISPFIGVGIYCLYLWKTTGDPFMFFSSQPAFGANRSTSIILLPQVYFRYIKIFLTAAPNFQYFTSVVEFLIFSLVFLVLILDFIKHRRNYDRVALCVFSLINIVLPTLTGTFSSVPRYTLLSLSFFLFINEIKNTLIKTAIIILFLIFHVILLGFFVQGYFVG